MMECFDENCQFKDIPHVHAFSENEDTEEENNSIDLIIQAFKEVDPNNDVHLLSNGDLLITNMVKHHILYIPEGVDKLIGSK